MPGLPSDVYPELQRVLGKRLEVRGYALSGLEGDLIRDHVAQLDQFQPNLFRRLVRQGLKSIEVAPGSVADFPGYEHLANMQAPGHVEGVTLSDIAGGYDFAARRLLLGTQGLNVDGLVPHELGHAMGDLLGMYRNKSLREGYLRNARAGLLSDFYLDNGEPSDRGLEEFFADLVRDAILKGKATRLYGLDIERFVAKVLRNV